MLRSFWKWYQNHLLLNQVIVASLFVWQILHLYWLTMHVIANKLIGYPIFIPTEFYQLLLVIADYFEIPVLISGTLVYLHSLNEGNPKKNLIFLLLINSQWLHLFWITDEFVVEKFRESSSTILPVWIAWLAIFIDYLELPVIYDTFKKVIKKLLTPETDIQVRQEFVVKK